MKKLLLLLIALFSVMAFARSQQTGTVVAIETNLGTIEVQLEDEKAPKTVANFLHYAEQGFYDGTIFHRVIPGFMIQGGGFTKNMVRKETDLPIINEGNKDLRNYVGTIAMARLPDPDSATSQFFINVENNESLNYRSPQEPGYAVFGKVISGMEVVNEIAAVPTTSYGQHQNVPRRTIQINSVTVVKK